MKRGMVTVPAAMEHKWKRAGKFYNPITFNGLAQGYHHLAWPAMCVPFAMPGIVQFSAILWYDGLHRISNRSLILRI